MLDLKFIRENVELVKKGLAAKNVKLDLSALLEMDEKRRAELKELEDLRNKQNIANDEISKNLGNEEKKRDVIVKVKALTMKVSVIAPQVKITTENIEEILFTIPNLPHSSVPIGSAEKNKEVRKWGEPRKFDFKPKTHVEIAEALDIIDFKRAAKITGSNFVVFKNEGARLERALINFMIDLHTQKHGYTEIFPPFLVNRASMTGTGQLPKMEEDMYKLAADDFFLIPTAEVPITNLHRDEILDEKELPIFYTGYTACFRREAGSYGKDIKGLVRVHQFDKVELVKFVKPGTSYDELEKLVANAEATLQLLGLPHRVILLASGDLSFAASKCYDLESHAPGLDKWLEVSSCSNFEDFQARRANIRFKSKTDKKVNFVHTLNGSGVALARTMIAILENYQTQEGGVLIPEALQSYMGGQKKIGK